MSLDKLFGIEVLDLTDVDSNFKKLDDVEDYLYHRKEPEDGDIVMWRYIKFEDGVITHELHKGCIKVDFRSIEYNCNRLLNGKHIGCDSEKYYLIENIQHIESIEDRTIIFPDMS